MASDRPRLDERIPEHGFADEDCALQAFLDWTEDRGLTLYDHQEEAVLELFAGQHVVLNTPTGSGKSLVALALHFQTFAALGRTVYTAPIKALVSEKFFALCEVFGAEHVGLMTGDGAVNRDAPILCCTAEILANMALREGEQTRVDSVVMDEFHYYADRDRGMAWQIPLLVLKNARFLLMSATLGDTTAIREDLEQRTGLPAVEVRSAKRPVPLEFSYSTDPIHDTIDTLLRQDKAPVYVVHFTQRAAAEQAQALMSTDLCTKEEKQTLREAVKGERFDSPYGKTVRRYVLHGVGVHHAGLLPRYRRLVERLAQRGLLKVICGTDTLGVGINVPIRAVLFTRLCKYDGEKVAVLRIRDFQQVAGRAGRAGFDTVGFVVAQAPEHVIDNRRAADKAAAKGRKKPKSKPAPTRGYKHWDRKTFERLATRRPETLESRFTVDHGRLVSAMQHAAEHTGDARGGVAALGDLIDRSHETARNKARLHDEVSALLDDLIAAEVVHDDGEVLSLAPDLQRDFSLHHSLSLFLVGALGSLDPGSETHALDVVSLTEAILEQPRAVLTRQQDKARTELHWQLKNEGVPFEERQAALDEVTWPKPQADWIYKLFNAYREHHPWVRGEDIHPKSIVRDLLEQLASFTTYVQDLGLERSEGVLLRYLTNCYKALLQNVPAERHTDALIEVLATLRAMLARVDASLITEWEALVAGKDAADAEVAPAPVDISLDRKRFHARIRAELHALVRACARGDFEEAAASVRPGDDPWTADRFDAALAPFVDEFGPPLFDHRARLGHHTTIRPDGHHQWRVSQRLVDPEEEAAWFIEGRIDLREDTNPAGPLVEVTALAE